MAFQAAPDVNWEKLRQVLPLDSSREQRDARQQLFKDLVVRGMAPRQGTAASKAPQKSERHRIRGTLPLQECELDLQALLLRCGAVTEVAPSLTQAIHRAFYAARAWVEPVTAFDGNEMDMNQFHQLLTHFAFDVDLRSCLAAAGFGRNPANVAVTLEDFQRFLGIVASPTPRLHCDWSRIGEFAQWRENSEAAFSELRSSSGCMMGKGTELTYEKLIERCLQHVVADAVTSTELLAENRKAAFQLIQALQNVDSLPNCVPGPFSADLESSRSAVSSRGATRTSSPGFSHGLFAGEQVGGPLAWRSTYQLSNEAVESIPRNQPSYIPLGAVELIPPPTNRGREESSLTVTGAHAGVAPIGRRSPRLAAAGGAACKHDIVTSISQGGSHSARGPVKLMPGRILYKWGTSGSGRQHEA